MKKHFLALAIISFFHCNAQNSEATTSLQTETEKLKKSIPDSLKPWKKGGLVSLAGQQVSLTNWAAGGQSAVSANGLLNLYANYSKGTITWANNLDLAYGVIKQGENKNWWKNDDRIQITSKFGKKAYKSLFYSGLMDFKSQFAPGYNYPNDSVQISNLLAPAYGIVALGLDYKPNDNVSVFLAPVTGKFTIVNDETLADAGAFGVEKAELKVDPATGKTEIVKHGKKHREEFGGYLKFQYKQKIMDNVNFETMLELFSNYLHNPQNIDVNWTTLTSMKVNKYISATFATQLIYDDDIMVLRNGGTRKGTFGPDVQFKQALSVGFNYKF